MKITNKHVFILITIIVPIILFCRGLYICFATDQRSAFWTLVVILFPMLVLFTMLAFIVYLIFAMGSNEITFEIDLLKPFKKKPND